MTKYLRSKLVSTRNKKHLDGVISIRQDIQNSIQRNKGRWTPEAKEEARQLVGLLDKTIKG